MEIMCVYYTYVCMYTLLFMQFQSIYNLFMSGFAKCNEQQLSSGIYRIR